MEDRAISLNDIKEAMGILKTECELQIAENDTKSRLLISNLFCKMLEIIRVLPPVPPTQMIDKSNFSQEQYKMDLQSAYDCGRASVTQSIRDQELHQYDADKFCPKCGCPMEIER